MLLILDGLCTYDQRMVRQIKEYSYVEAARSLGASHWRLIFRHLIPNSITPAIVLAARDIGALVLFKLHWPSSHLQQLSLGS